MANTSSASIPLALGQAERRTDGCAPGGTSRKEHLRGAFFRARRALEDMLQARHGRVVNVSSVVAERGNPGQANDAAANVGPLGFTGTIAREIARRSLTCDAVTPGVTETDMTADVNGAAPPVKGGVGAYVNPCTGGARQWPTC
jgi:NAD(P)-dependent dehydrogenase (short-subunit alcohol dehydrogenase family)